MAIDPARLELLSALNRKVLWLSSWTIHHANHIRPNSDGLKVGGHQASSASLATIMSALYFHVLRPEDRVAVKPHAILRPQHREVQGRHDVDERGRRSLVAADLQAIDIGPDVVGVMDGP